MNEISSVVRWIHRTQIVTNVFLVICATILIGAALPNGHRYEGGWIFGLAWFPIILFATIEIVTASGLPQRFVTAIGSFFLPYVFVALNIVLGNDVSLTTFVVQAAMLNFTASMLAFALQAAVFPPLFGKVKNISGFIQEEALPQLFGAGAGFVVSYLAFSFLLSEEIITATELPLLFAGILSSAIPLGRSLYRTRY